MVIVSLWDVATQLDNERVPGGCQQSRYEVTFRKGYERPRGFEVILRIAQALLPHVKVYANSAQAHR